VMLWAFITPAAIIMVVVAVRGLLIMSKCNCIIETRTISTLCEDTFPETSKNVSGIAQFKY